MTFFTSLTRGHKPDWVFLTVVLILVVGGLLMLSSASSDKGKIEHGDAYYFVTNQLIKGLLPGVIGFLVGFGVYYRRWQGKIATILLLLNLILLVLVFSPIGVSANGSHRWITVGPITFQPSEFLKITFVLYLASLLSSANMKNMKKGWKTYCIFLLVSLVVVGLILIEPATTMAIILVGAGAIMYLLSGAPWKHIILTVMIGVIVVALLVVVTPYRFKRIVPNWNVLAQNFFPSLVVERSDVDTFHLNQSLIAIGTGQITGVGFGKSTSKYSVLPEAMGDSIFAVIGEELGFVGGVLVVGAYLVLMWRGTAIVLRSDSGFARLVVIGFVSIVGIQALIHIGANTGLLPLTGITLPFISYGGTSLAVTLTMMGIVGNISRYTAGR